MAFFQSWVCTTCFVSLFVSELSHPAPLNPIFSSVAEPKLFIYGSGSILGPLFWLRLQLQLKPYSILPLKTALKYNSSTIPIELVISLSSFQQTAKFINKIIWLRLQISNNFGSTSSSSAKLHFSVLYIAPHIFQSIIYSATHFSVLY